MNLYPTPLPLTGPAASCFFETLHEPSPSPCLTADALDKLSMDQLVEMEQMIRKVKKRKARQMALESSNSAACTKKRKVDVEGGKSVMGPPVIEVRDGVEWVSFVYSHNRVLQRHAIRTDIDDLGLDAIDPAFQLDNCVYPRANVPKETYQGNRWNYETQCNILGWKLAWINPEIVGKRGLIQRAVDSYRNRTPTMRSRRVARQTKMLNGTLRKRHSAAAGPDKEPSPVVDPEEAGDGPFAVAPHIPKTMTMEDEHHMRFRVKIALDSVDLDTIDTSFRLANCVYPRALKVDFLSSDLPPKWMEENVCNELGWKMAWLNPKLVHKRNLLQRALDLYRLKFMPGFTPRQRSCRTPPSQQFTTWTLPDLNQHPVSPSLTCTTGTTESLDFGDCFSMEDDNDDEDMVDGCDLASINTSHTTSSGYSDNAIYTPLLSPLLPLSHQTASSFTVPFFDTSVESDPLISQDLPSSAMTDFSKSYDQGVFGHDLLLRMEETVDDLFHFS